MTSCWLLWITKFFKKGSTLRRKNYICSTGKDENKRDISSTGVFDLLKLLHKIELKIEDKIIQR